MFDSVEAGNAIEVDRFLQTARSSLKQEAYKKSRLYGFDFILDRPREPAQRFVWSEDTDRQLKLSSRSNFAQMRLAEAQKRQQRLANVRSTTSTHAVAEESPSPILEDTDKQLYFDCDQRRTFTRSSISTLATLTSEDRMSTSPFEYDLDEGFRDSDVDR